jgi:hypothetical protein
MRENTMRTITLPALSVVRPWGTKIATGEKTVEVRRWSPTTVPLRVLLVENDRLLPAGESDDDGRAVAMVTIASVREWTPDLAAAACAEWEAGWLAWMLEEVKAIAEPFRVRADRKIYELTIDATLVDSDDGALLGG